MEIIEQDAPVVSVSLKVINKNEFTCADMFDGVPYEFEPGKPVTIPADAAFHIFGWTPEADAKAVRSHVQKRWGWNTPAMVEKGDHERFFANLELRAVRFRLVEMSEEDAEPLPAVPLRGAAARSHAQKTDKEKGAQATA